MNVSVCQRWRRGRSSYRPAGETIDTRRYHVDLVPDDATARTFVVARQMVWHRSRSALRAP